MARWGRGKLDKVLLEVIACPVCHGKLSEKSDELLCAGCPRAYPIRDGVPVLLADEARMRE